MHIRSIDHIVFVVPSLDAAAPFERLGLNLTPPARHAGLGTENRAFMVASDGADFYVEFLSIHDQDAARAAGRTRYLEVLEKGGGVARLMLAVDDLEDALKHLAMAGIETRADSVHREDGTRICDVAPLDDAASLGLTAGLVQYAENPVAMYERRLAAGRYYHQFPLARLDHLAAMAPALEATSRAWDETLGVPVAGEVRGRGMIINQHRIGDAVLEFLGPETPDSPIASRPPGLLPMVAFEVKDLQEAVALAKERGFTPSEPAAGVLPGTRTATIPAGELSGLSLQMLQYLPAG